MCTQKTRRTVQYVSGLDPSARILIVSTRITLSYKQKADFGISHYLDADFDIEKDRMIIGYESLRRLEFEGQKPFDYIIMDECRSLMSNATCTETNKRYFQQNFEMLQKFLQACRQTIVLDADLEIDGSCAAFLQGTVSASEIEVHRYSGHAPNMERTAVFTTDETSFVQSIEQSLVQGMAVCVTFRSKSRLDVINRYIEKLGLKPMSISSDTSDVQIRETFDDIDDALKEKPCFLYTSKLNVGVSVEQIVYDVMYVDCKANSTGIGGACPRSMNQSTGRFRSLTSKRVSFLMDTLEPQSDDGLMQKIEANLTLRKGIASEYKQFVLTSKFERGLELKFTPSLLGRLYTMEQFEQTRNFTRALFSQLRSKGWSLEFESHDVKPYDRLVELRAELKEEKQVKAEAAFEFVKFEGATDTIMTCDHMVRSHEAEADTKLKLEIAHVLKHFEAGYDPRRDRALSNLDSYEDYKLAKKNMNAIKNIALTGPLMLLREKSVLLTRDCVDLTVNMTTAQLRWVDECATLLGVERSPEALFFEKEAFVREEQKVLDLCKKSAIARDPDGGYLAPKGKRPGSKAVTAFRRELMMVLGRNLEKCPLVLERGVRSVCRYKSTIDTDLARLADKSNFVSNAAKFAKSTATDVASMVLSRHLGKRDKDLTDYIHSMIPADYKRMKLSGARAPATEDNYRLFFTMQGAKKYLECDNNTVDQLLDPNY